MKKQIKNLPCTTKTKAVLLFVFFVLFYFSPLLWRGVGGEAISQNIGINQTGALPNASAGLDVDYNNKGLLAPRVALTSTTDAATIPTPANGLIVFNTNAAMTNGAGVGLYFYCSNGCSTAGWKFMSAADNGPGTTGQVLTSQGPGAQEKWTTPPITTSTTGGGGATGCAACITNISTVEYTGVNWSTCRENCRTLVEGGFSDWRIPTWDEIVYYSSGSFDPPDGTWIVNWVWTSSPCDAKVTGGVTTNTWITLYESVGSWSCNTQTGAIACRCVR